jgi:hypothetical protein
VHSTVLLSCVPSNICWWSPILLSAIVALNGLLYHNLPSINSIPRALPVPFSSLPRPFPYLSFPSHPLPVPPATTHSRLLAADVPILPQTTNHSGENDESQLVLRTSLTSSSDSPSIFMYEYSTKHTMPYCRIYMRKVPQHAALCGQYTPLPAMACAPRAFRAGDRPWVIPGIP